MSSRILYLQTPLECLKDFYPSTRLIFYVHLRMFVSTTYVHSHGPNQTKFTIRAQTCLFVGYALHQRDYNFFHSSSHKCFVSMNVTFLEDCPFFLVSLLQGESVSEESNYVVPLKCTYPTLFTLCDPDSHTIVLPTD